MKIKIVFEINDTERRAISASMGMKGKADYETAKQYLTDNGVGGLEEIVFDYLQSHAGG